MMLQQTQVDRVVPHYERFLVTFPTPAACAAAGPAAVVRLWSGLGYNRRALNLHRAAMAIGADHRGAVPSEDAALRTLPGVGPYTARAVRAFAFGDDVAAIDTNGVRVLARGVTGVPLTVRQAMMLGDRLVPAGESWEFNQAMFDLGAAVCTAARPDCRALPVAPPVRLAPPGQRRSGPVAAEPGGATTELLRRIGPPGPGAAAQRAARGRRAAQRPGGRLRLARGRAAG